MGNKVFVSISAEMKVKLSKTVEMDEEDYEEYLSLVDSELSYSDIDSKIAAIAHKYNFDGSPDDWVDFDDPEEIEFKVIE
ncbi:hypothetical protein I2492_19490 [Budviciaceae bacterium CWB-B4]|uniref:Uncharacterized protein n=1 Tax=Limnobaculum xujianqingii TaxID=2738837 RepID=A0A9D7ALV0_9GAMM|nr:hypothetical protein [Limnobaculum xujianqingii]MBK5075185.1 hypothetical protein [Limnobaculum xujianqingii]MBK5178495.1 hypothetical protein [Limnobaculum xujianqingii]